MKKFLELLLILWATATFAQVPTIPNEGGVLATQEWVRQYVRDFVRQTPSLPGENQPEMPQICDLTVRSYVQKGNALEFDLWASQFGISPYDVTLEQNGTSWTWRNIPQGFGEPMRLEGLPTTGTATVTIRSLGKPGCSTSAGVKITEAGPKQGPKQDPGTDPGRGDSDYPATLTSGRMLVMNATGWGFAPEDPTGIAPDWRRRVEAFQNLTYNGERFKVLDGFRLLVRWYEYEPQEGVYRDDALLAAYRWCKERGLKFAVCVWPLRGQNDGFLPESDWVKGMYGSHFVWEGWQCQPALYSEIGRQKFARAMRHMAQVLAPYEQDIIYITLAYGDTEEYFSPPIVRHNPWRVTEVTGYSEVNKAAWRTFLANKGVAYHEPPVPNGNEMPWSTAWLWNHHGHGRLWYQFMTLGLREFWWNFRQAVKDGSSGKLKVAGFYADCGGGQSAWYMTYDLKTIFEGSDVIYSSEGGGNGDLARKMLATDFNRGTFPQAAAAIEFDPRDLSFDDKGEPHSPLNPNALREWGSSFFRRGGQIIHFAMTFRPGEEGTHNQIADLAEGLYYLRKEMIEKEPDPIPSETRTAVLSRMEGDPYNDVWWKAGGGRDRQVKLVVDNKPFWQ